MRNAHSLPSTPGLPPPTAWPTSKTTTPSITRLRVLLRLMATFMSSTERRYIPLADVNPRRPGGVTLEQTTFVSTLVCSPQSRRPSPSFTVVPRSSYNLTPPRTTTRPLSSVPTRRRMIGLITLYHAHHAPHTFSIPWSRTPLISFTSRRTS